MKPGTIVVKVADLQVAQGDGELVTLGLGSCVAICLHDPAAKVAGMAHILLPNRSLSPKSDNLAKFPQSAVPVLVEQMVAIGADKSRITGKLIGGSAMFGNLTSSGSVQMGERNIVAARQVLADHGIAIKAEATGGTVGRSVRFQASDGLLMVRTLRTGEESV